MDFNEFFIYDESVESCLINKIGRRKAKINTPVNFSIDHKGYPTVNIKGKHILAHKIIWMMHYGEVPEGFEIDHKDTNPLNIKIENLRLSTRQQNTWNTKKHTNRISDLPKGIYYHKKSGKYIAQVCINGVRYNNHSDDIEKLQQWLIELREKHQMGFHRH